MGSIHTVGTVEERTGRVGTTADLLKTQAGGELSI